MLSLQKMELKDVNLHTKNIGWKPTDFVFGQVAKTYGSELK